MPKIRDSGQKPDLFEVTTTQTRQGKRLSHIPVKDSQLLPSTLRSTSPSKKRALSPEVFVADDDDNVATDQTPKRSKTVGKVRMNIPCTCTIIKCFGRLRISFLMTIWVDNIVFWSNFSDTNLFRQDSLAPIVNNHLEHIGVRIALVEIFCVVPVVCPLTQPSHFIAFKCGMDIVSSGQIFLHMIWH